MAQESHIYINDDISTVKKRRRILNSRMVKTRKSHVWKEALKVKNARKDE